MRGVPAGRRTARFVCVIAIVLPDGRSWLRGGRLRGESSQKTMTGGHGFGYDPIFFLPGIGKTMAELPLDEKNRISHRAKALERMREILMTLGK